LATWSFEFESGSLQTSEQVRAGQQSFPEKLEGSLTALAIVRTRTGQPRKPAGLLRFIASAFWHA
jgi:hypothetical protein